MSRISAGVRLLFLVLVSVALSSAQSQRGTIVGTVVDPSGAVIPNVKVEVINLETNAKFEAVTNQNGYYNVPYLPYGKYTVSLSVPGFKVYTVTDVEVATATTSTVNVTLSVEAQSQELSVSAGAVLLETTKSAVSTTVEQKLKDDIPVSNRRNPLAYLFTVPGYQPSPQTTLAGGRYGSNNILLDGQSPDLSITSQGDFGNPSLPSVESIGEFAVLLNSVPAEYGRTGGPTISFATRSGTNDYHGAAYEYYDNSDFNARAWQAATRGEARQHYFGFVAGGPVVIPKVYHGKNKSFFFADYSDIRNSSAGGATAIATLATDAMRRGDFSAPDILPLYDPLNATTDASGTRFQQFPGNQLPVSRLSRVSKFFFDKLPPANRPGSINNFVGTLPAASSTQWLLSVKGDHYISAKDRISAFYQGSRPKQIVANVLGDDFGNESSINFNRIRLDWSRNFTPGLSHQLVVGVTRQYSSNVSRNFGQNLGQKAGLTGTFDPNCPRVEIDRAQQSSFTFCFDLASLQAITNSTLNYSMLYMHGSHTFKWGAEYLKFNQNSNSSSASIFSASGAYNFGGGSKPRPSVSPIAKNATSQTDNTGGNSWADFYLGLPSVAYLAAPVVLGYRQAYFASYFQDDWRVTPRLTINAGLRWDLNVPYSEVHGQMSRFDATTPNPGAAGRPGALVYYGNGPGLLGTNQAGDYHFKNFGPRLGFAYNWRSKTVFRGFGGILYHSVQNTNVDFADRSGYQASGEPRLPANRFSQYYSWDQPFPQDVLGKVPNADPAFRNGQLVQAQDPGGVARAPASYMLSFGVQREMKGGILVDVSYISTAMKHGTDRLQLNFLPEQYWKLGRLLDLPLSNPEVKAAGFGPPYPGFSMDQPLYQALRPYPQYLDVAENATNGTSSNYNALMIKVQKRFSSGLSFLANYTASKFITDSQWAAGGFGAFPRIANNRKLDKGLYRFDIPKRLVLTYSYDLPFGKGKKFLNHGRILDLAVGGWNITGLQQYQAGWPAAFTGSFNTTIPTIGGVSNRVAGVPTRSSVSCGDMQFGNPAKNYLFNAGNPAQAAKTGRPLAFEAAGGYQVGNVPRIDPQARQCGRENEDLTIFKSFTIRENIRFRFGAEAYNLFNRHTWVSGVNGQPVTAPDFGEVLPDQPFGPRTVRLKIRLEW